MEKATHSPELTASLLDATAKIACASADGLRIHTKIEEAMPTFIKTVYAALSEAVGGAIAAAKEEPKAPAVNPKRSVFPEHIICLEDGKKFKSLKRHLSTEYGLTPDEYRAKWGLPANYPMVAPNYAATRSQLAKASGLGRKPAAAGKREA
ncbi:Transcriptional regulator, MucR family [Mesorhizobium plurifarium]|uniref:Transcriptional regulator, MucR family n=1 Tax=Mesorhizobium plurifarium TaxID=69974 RepID=A0A090EG11_MESPL|nr:Transcriptional regulator, MucR family [Mesorhizobium plurifarium]